MTTEYKPLQKLTLGMVVLTFSNAHYFHPSHKFEFSPGFAVGAFLSQYLT